MGTQNEFSDQQHPSDDVRVENCKRDTGENGGSDAEGDPKRPQIDGEIASPSKAGAHQAPIGTLSPLLYIAGQDPTIPMSIPKRVQLWSAQIHFDLVYVAGDTEPAPAVVDTEADEKLSIQQPEGLVSFLVHEST